jgi:hypothetical protein
MGRSGGSCSPSRRARTGAHQIHDRHTRTRLCDALSEPGFEETEFGPQDSEPGLEETEFGPQDSEPDLEETDFCLQDSDPGLEKTDFCLQDSDPGLEKTDFCLQDSDPGLEETDFCLQDSDPGLEETDFCLQDSDPGLEETDFCLQDSDPGLEETDFGLRKQNWVRTKPGSESCKPGSEKCVADCPTMHEFGKTRAGKAREGRIWGHPSIGGDVLPATAGPTGFSFGRGSLVAGFAAVAALRRVRTASAGSRP